MRKLINMFRPPETGDPAKGAFMEALLEVAPVYPDTVPRELVAEQPSLAEAVAQHLDVIQNARPSTIVERYDAVFAENLASLQKTEQALSEKIERDSEELRQTRVAIAATKAGMNVLHGPATAAELAPPRVVKTPRANHKARVTAADTAAGAMQ